MNLDHLVELGELEDLPQLVLQVGEADLPATSFDRGFYTLHMVIL